MSDDPTDFAQQYLAAATVMEMPLPDKLAIYYHVRCEHLDRTITNARDAHGDALLIHPWEKIASTCDAESVIQQLLSEYREVTEGALRRAINKYGQRYTTAALEQMLERINAEDRERLQQEASVIRAILGIDETGSLDLAQVPTAEQIARMLR